MRSLILEIARHFLIAICIVFIGGLTTGILQNGLNLSFSPIKPRLDKISILKGLERLFSLNSVIELLNSMLKLIFLTVILYTIIYNNIGEIVKTYNTDIQFSIHLMSTVVAKILFGIFLSMIFIALYDLLYRRKSYIDNLKMSKQEIKDEMKQQQGNPHVKGKQRSQMNTTIQTLSESVDSTDFVITNPTHYSIGIKYESSMFAPIVTAKGIDDIALKIRELAKERAIPVIENKSLARGIYSDCKIGEYISEKHYVAVAKYY